MLPVFYRNHEFTLDFLSRDNESRFRVQDHTALFLTTLSSDAVSDICRLHVRIGTCWHRTNGTRGQDLFWNIRIELSKEAGPKGYCIHVPKDINSWSTSMEVSEWRTLENELTTVLETICSGEGRKKFTLNNIYALRTAVEKPYK